MNLAEENLDVLRRRCEELTTRLKVADETLDAIRRGEVDAVVIDGREDPQIYVLRSADRPYRTLVEAMHEGALTLSTDGLVLYANRRYAELLGRGPEDVIGHELRDELPPESRDELERLLTSPPGTMETFLIGEKRYVPVTLSISAMEIEESACFAVVFTDLTAQKAHEAVVQAERTARVASDASNQAKDEFLMTVSHELRTPLTLILGWATMLSTFSVDAETLRIGITSIEQNARAQTALVEDLLDVSRIATGQVRLSMQPVDLSALVERTLTSFRTSAEARHIMLSFSCSDDLPLVEGDRVRLQQVFWNLLTNSLKFTPDGGRIDVSCSAEEGVVRVVVRDTGCGLAADLVPQLFTRFTRGDTSASRQYSGLGLGLSVAHDLVRAHGGTISATSDGPGLGTEFTVVLPADTRSRAAARAPSFEQLAQLPLHGLSVLALDDDAATRVWLTKTLQLFGASVHAAAATPEAFDLFEQERIDVVISDLATPMEGGLDFVARLRRVVERGKSVPVIALTAGEDPDARARLIAAGFDEYLRKPIAAADLVRTVYEASVRSPRSQVNLP